MNSNGKITGGTTLAQLAILRGQLGVVRLTIDYSHDYIDYVLVTLTTPGLSPGDDHVVVKGRGATEAEALDDAFSRLTHRLGEAVCDGRVAEPA